LITPPYGIALLMRSKFLGVRFGRAMFASFPIYIVFLATSRSASSFRRRAVVGRWAASRIHHLSVIA